MQIEILNDRGELIAAREIGERRDVAFNRLTVTGDLLAQAGKRIGLRFRLPIIDMQGVWSWQHYGPDRPQMKLPWTIRTTSAQQSDIPYCALLRMDQTNAATIALTCVHDDAEITGKMDQMRCCYAWDVTVAVTPETEPFDLLLSFAEKRWDLLLRDWRELVLPDGPPEFPDAAFEPVYCTWYAAHAALTTEYLDRNAELAAELGFRTFIVDDGWSYDEMKRVCPEKMAEGWYRDIGNWTVSEKKLPDCRKHIEYAQSLGLKYLLWTAPFFAGICTNEYKAVKDEEKETEFCSDWGDVSILDPDGKAADHAVGLLKNLMTDLKLDGLKIDFLDAIPKDVSKPRSRACLRYFQKLADAIRSVKPDALLEFRQSYATPQMLPFGTQFRAGDVPFDFIQNLYRLAQIRLVVGDRVPCHADPIYFHPQEKPENAARHMIAALAGVPMLSMELSGLSAEHKRIIRFWLDFYKAHLGTLAMGRWDVIHTGDSLACLAAEGEKEVIAIVVAEGRERTLADTFTGKDVFLLNMTGNSLAPVPGASVFDCFGGAAEGNAAPPAGMTVLKR